MTAYVPGDEAAEILLGQAYVTMMNDGDLSRVFQSPPSLHHFLKVLQPPTFLVFDHDAKGIYIMCWMERMLGGAVFALWIRKDRRKSQESYKNYLRALYAALLHFPVVMGITEQKALVEQHCRFGYNLLCTVDGLYGAGRPGYVMQVDREKILARVRRTHWSDDEREFFKQQL